MTVLGLTGAFCSGKSTVALFLKGLGTYIIDADKIVHECYKKDAKVKRAIVREFGKDILKGKSIDRNKLALLALKRKKNLNRLLRIVHPAVLKKIKRSTLKSRNSIIVIDAPLLIESGLHKFTDYVIVVKCDLKKRLLRCKKKGFTKNDLIIRNRFQMPLAEKLRHADFVVNNNLGKKNTKREVKRLWDQLKRER